ncbi:MAG: response regulator [Methanoregula sp.]|jgi:DNA-binding response OmpR family regulator
MVMNSEPSGTDADIPDGESAIDVFILCKDTRDSQHLKGELTPQGYRVTLFSNSTELFESLREGKPNLLICDTSGPEQEGYDVCREIKTDDDLWRIPVLLVTGIANLGDLLSVLDSNADNFIARPYDLQYLLSLIETMLASTVEKPDPEKVRTQFKIRHEERDYVITADRRKLLEFLLSSFEIAVDRAGELAQTQSALDNLKSTLERRIADRTSELVTETARLQMLINGKTRDLESAGNVLSGLKKEGDALRSQLEEREMVIAGTKDDLTRLTQELEATRARLAEADDTIRTLGTEKDELEQALRGDAETLNRDLGQSRRDLEEAKKELTEISGHRATLETQLAELAHKHEDAQKALGTRSIEIEQLKSSLAAEKNRAEAADQEVKSVLQEKARSEQDLRQMIGDITEKAKQQSHECLRLADELAGEKEHRGAAEQQCSTLAQEVAKKEAAFAAEKGTLMEHHEALQKKYDALTESFGAERQKSTSREAELVRITEARDQMAREMQVLKEQFDAAVAALEEEKRLRDGAEKSGKELAESKDGEVRELNTTLNALRRDLEKARSDLVHIQQERDAALSMHKSLSEDLAAAVLAKAQSEKLAHSAASAIEQIQNELETERRLRHAAEDKLSEVTRVKENIERNLNATGEQVAAHERELLVKIQGLTKDLASEREACRKADENLAHTALAKEQAEQKLRAITDERVAEDARREDQSRKLEDNLRTALDRQRSLEGQLRDAEQEQAEKEVSLKALGAEIEQVAAALEAEKEERHAAEEAYAETKDALVALRKKTQIPSTAIEEVPIEKHAMVTKGPDLPTVIMHGPQALSRKEIDHLVLVQPMPTDEPEVRIRSMEDLFEDPKELDVHDLPDATRAPGIPDGVTGNGVRETSGDESTGAAGDGDTAPGENDPEDAETADDDDETGYDAGAGSTSGEERADHGPATESALFGRQQWLDLVKWAHNTDALAHEDRIRIVKLGRLIQKGRRLTRRQEEQLAELVALARAMGYSGK